MRARTPRGHYTRHNTPGDGTGMDRVPTGSADSVLTDVDPKAQHLPRQTAPPMRKASPRHTQR